MYGSEEFHKEIRMQMLIEGVLNQHHYLDHNYLSIGAKHTYKKATLPVVFAQYSDEYVPPNFSQDLLAKKREEMLNKIAHEVYEHDILKQKQLGTYMGIWHLFQAANVLSRPIQSVFPIRGSSNFRNMILITLSTHGMMLKETEKH